MTTETQTKPKLTWLQKIGFRKLFKNTQTKLNNWKKDKDEKKEQKIKGKLITSITNLQEIINIEKEDGTPLLYPDMITMTNKELIEIIEQAIHMAEEVI